MEATPCATKHGGGLTSRTPALLTFDLLFNSAALSISSRGLDQTLHLWGSPQSMPPPPYLLPLMRNEGIHILNIRCIFMHYCTTLLNSALLHFFLRKIAVQDCLCGLRHLFLPFSNVQCLSIVDFHLLSEAIATQECQPSCPIEDDG